MTCAFVNPAAGYMSLSGFVTVIACPSILNVVLLAAIRTPRDDGPGWSVAGFKQSAQEVQQAGCSRMSDRIAGILPAIITPFTEDEQFSPGVMERLLGRLYIAGVDGVYVCGQTGEGLLQSVEMREHVAEVVVRNSPPEKLVIVHVSSLPPIGE